MVGVLSELSAQRKVEVSGLTERELRNIAICGYTVLH